MYPNPIGNLLNIEFKSKNKSATFQINNLTGQTIRKGKLGELMNRLDLSDLTSGFYLLQIKNNEGIFSKGIIIN